MSSILESGNGLFNTHVTLEDVEDVIQEQMKTKSQFGRATEFSLYAQGNVLKSLAHLQAGSLDLTDEELKSITGFDFMKMVGPLLGEDGVKSMLQQANAINPQRFSDEISKIQEFGHEIINLELIINMNKYVGIKQAVLVHEDVWAPNVLWTKTNGIHKVDRIIDYQGIHMGNPAEDLVRLFISTLSGNDRQNNWEKLLFQFYKYFQEALGKGQKAPYSLDQLKES